MYLHELNTFDKLFDNKQVFIVSIGSIEQHGKYGPLGTDFLVQNALIERVEQALPDVVFLPTMPLGPCWQQLGFNGTVSLRESTLYSMLEDIVDSLKENANTILFVSWHGGNKPVISKFLDEKSPEYKEIQMDQITFGDEETDIPVEKLLNGPPDDHAGNTEVSLMLAVRPDITKQPNSIDDKQPNSSFEWDKRIVDIQSDGVIDEHPKWVTSPEIGEEMLKIYSENLIKKIKSKI